MPRKIFLATLAILMIFTGCHQSVPEETNTFPSQVDESTVATQSTTTAPETVPTEAETAPTEETTAPTVPETRPEDPEGPLWTPICNEYINLWGKADQTEFMGHVPVNAKLVLLKWQGKMALISYNGKQGYVSANYIQPVEENYFGSRLQVVSPTTKYTYQQMQADMAALQALHPNLVQISSIGKSEEGRDIPVMIVGNANAVYHVLIQGAMHGREHFTAWLAMAIADQGLKQNLLGNVCYHIIPMSNPDGVTISQTATLNDVQKEIYQKDLASGYTYQNNSSNYAIQWKANGLGVDLNRNFSSGWENSLEHSHPSAQKFRGTAPFSAAEARALADYTQSRQFDATISLHSHGSVLYYQYGKRQPVNDQSYTLAKAVSQVTGYTPISYDGTTGAGYKDWAMDFLGIPSLTVEIGSTTTPLEQRDSYNTFDRFQNFFPAISQWLHSN